MISVQLAIQGKNMSNRDDTLFRIRFHHENNVYEIYARSLAQESIIGFLEVEEIVFNESSSVVVDPSEEKLKLEFQDVVCTYIPLHAVIRIDEVKKEGVAKVIALSKETGNKVLCPFPSHTYNKNKQPE